jgi:hypothetical protein
MSQINVNFTTNFAVINGADIASSAITTETGVGKKQTTHQTYIIFVVINLI